jgi:hypothetical protein
VPLTGITLTGYTGVSIVTVTKTLDHQKDALTHRG